MLISFCCLSSLVCARAIFLSALKTIENSRAKRTMPVPIDPTTAESRLSRRAAASSAVTSYSISNTPTTLPSTLVSKGASLMG